MCQTSNVGFFHYESELGFQGLVFKVGDVNIGEATGSAGHSVNYVFRGTAALFYLSYRNYIKNISICLKLEQMNPFSVDQKKISEPDFRCFSYSHYVIR